MHFSMGSQGIHSVNSAPMPAEVSEGDIHRSLDLLAGGNPEECVRFLEWIRHRGYAIVEAGSCQGPPRNNYGAPRAVYFSLISDNKRLMSVEIWMTEPWHTIRFAAVQVYGTYARDCAYADVLFSGAKSHFSRRRDCKDEEFEEFKALLEAMVDIWKLSPLRHTVDYRTVKYA